MLKVKSVFHLHQLMNLTGSWILSKYKMIFALSWVCCSIFCSNGQQQFRLDTSFLNMDSDIYFKEISKVDPMKSAMLSAILPGLGQINNKQAFKVPFVYAGFMGFAHFINENNKLYHTFRNAYLASTDNRADTENRIEGQFNSNALKQQADNLKRDRDYLVLLMTLFYLTNVAEAYISGHLREFKINDSFLAQLQPTIQSTPLSSPVFGFSLKFSF